MCVIGCETFLVLARGACKKHYRRWQSNKRRITSGVRFGDWNDCWEWTQLNWSDGRPCVYWYDIRTRERKKIHAMRAILLIEEGPLYDPDNGLEAAHSCHTPWCVNRRHGFWATHEQNMAGWVPDEVSV